MSALPPFLKYLMSMFFYALTDLSYPMNWQIVSQEKNNNNLMVCQKLVLITHVFA